MQWFKNKSSVILNLAHHKARERKNKPTPDADKRKDNSEEQEDAPAPLPPIPEQQTDGAGGELHAEPGIHIDGEGNFVYDGEMLDALARELHLEEERAEMDDSWADLAEKDADEIEQDRGPGYGGGELTR